MKLLLSHNAYQQPGGEDQVFALEANLLRAHGHEVVLYQATNDAVKGRGSLGLLSDTLWNRRTYAEVTALIRLERPDLLHSHNTFPLISPSIYYAARDQGIPVVQTLHNYRLVCPAATLFRDGRVCEDCLSRRVPWPGVVHACYRGSRTASAATAGMLTWHRIAHTWTEVVTAYIALSEFARAKFIEGGLPAEKLFVKPNSIERDPGMGAGDGGYALFVGRLTPEKGISTMLDAWREMGTALPLEIAGDGPMADEVKGAVASAPGIRFLGWQPRSAVLEKMKHATALVLPSTWYEGFPMILVEAYAVGLPVIASRLGSMASLIDHGRTGRHFEAGSAAGLAREMRWLLANESARQSMRREARREFEERYTGERNCARLVEIYHAALGARPGVEQASAAVL